jgi:hypothetical protein
VLEGQVEAHFHGHPGAEIIVSQLGLGPILGARVLGEFGDVPDRYLDAKSRKNCEDHGVPPWAGGLTRARTGHCVPWRRSVGHQPEAVLAAAGPAGVSR